MSLDLLSQRRGEPLGLLSGEHPKTSLRLRRSVHLNSSQVFTFWRKTMLRMTTYAPCRNRSRRADRGMPVHGARPHRTLDVVTVETTTGRRPSSLPRRRAGRPAAFFDLDKTIIAKSSTLAFSREFYAGGLINRRSVLRSAYAQFVYLVGGADHDQMEKMREFLSKLVTGWPVQSVREIVADTLHNIVDPLVYDEAVQLIEEHHLAGRDVIIVSASGTEVVDPIGEMLGADAVIATRLEVVDGRYTGTIDHYVYAENKALAIQELAEEKGYDLSKSYAYSDSITDLHMLEIVGHPFAVNPDKELRRIAATNGWPVLVFNKPVGLRTRKPRKQTVVAMGFAAAVAVGSIIYVGARRRIAGASSPA
jgi:HAD superfamily hydrolase (TIGR01490 family)